MIINKGSFFLALAGLAAGGAAGGYYVGEHGLPTAASAPGAAERQGAAPVAPAEPVLVVPAPVIAAPVCDDMVGAAGSCPAPGYPSEEGEGCGALPAKRCDDFKKAMKPRVAERAVACLNALTAAERCDTKRLGLCAHLALMNACPEPDAPASAGTAAPDDVDTRCQSIVQACGGSAFTPSTRDCRATVSGLSSFGRDQMVSCMKTHCADKGLVGCEAVIDAK